MDQKLFLLFIFVLNHFPDNRSDVYDIPVSPFEEFKILFENNYHIEEHNITTKDGYILTLHRISSKLITNEYKKPPIYLHHALSFDSSSWMWSIPNNISLPLTLSDAGYDIWLGNSRGNYYSRNHIKLNYMKSKDFWNFTWHEIGIYDLPCVIDYILNKTKSNKIHYIGHSQGTAAFFVLATELPEYNKKILSFHGLTPAVFMENTSSSYVQYLTNKYGDPNENYHEYSKTPPPIIVHRLAQYAGKFCKLFISGKFCTLLYSHIFGSNNGEHINEETAINIFSNTPQATSFKTVLHFFQIIKSGRFRKYDYGKRINKKLYGMLEPPDYDIKKITCPVFLYYSQYDSFSSYNGNVRLSNELPIETLYLNYTIPEKYKLNHLDVIHGKIANKVIFKKIINGLQKIENHNEI